MRPDRNRHRRLVRQRMRLTSPPDERWPIITPGRIALVAVLAQAAIVILIVVFFLTFGRGQH